MTSREFEKIEISERLGRERGIARRIKRELRAGNLTEKEREHHEERLARSEDRVSRFTYELTRE